MLSPQYPGFTRQLPHEIYSTEWVKQAEKQAAASLKLSLFHLMMRAGGAAFDLARTTWPFSRHWLVLCGNGNNGGDGYLLAFLAQAAGINVTLQVAQADKPLPDEASIARTIWLNAGNEILPPDVPWPETVDLIVDALLGSGLKQAPRHSIATLIERANRHAAPVLALDIPSGLLADSGAAPGSVIHAQHTISFIALKPGLLTGKARDVTGTLHYHSLFLDDWLNQQPASSFTRYDASQLATLLPARHPCAHKGEHGKLLMIGGDHGTGGAICMAAQAALRAGAGLVRVLTRQENIVALLSSRPELMTDELTGQTLTDGLQWADVLVVGPGLGLHSWGKQALQATEHFCKPMLWDADALNLLAQHPGQCANRLITPHPAEAARLLNCSVAQIESDRLLATTQLQERYGGYVLLKGAGSLITDGRQHGIIDIGNPGMATAGMGDILSGIIGGLLVQGLNPYQALCAGALAHSASADMLAIRYGVRGMLAMDVLDKLYYFLNPDIHHD